MKKTDRNSSEEKKKTAAGQTEQNDGVTAEDSTSTGTGAGAEDSTPEEAGAAAKDAAPEEAGAAAAAAAASVLEEEEKKEEEKEAAEKAAKEKKDPKDVQIAELEDKLKRQLAEFDNFRKRTEREKAQMFDMGARSVLEKILPTIDNFERSLANAPETEEAKAYVDGMQMVYKQFLKNLEEAGVKAMDAKGKPFDPNFHNAVMHVEDDSLGENVVAEELQKGYLYKDTVLRHSMVKVAN